MLAEHPSRGSKSRSLRAVEGRATYSFEPQIKYRPILGQKSLLASSWQAESKTSSQGNSDKLWCNRHAHLPISHLSTSSTRNKRVDGNWHGITQEIEHYNTETKKTRGLNTYHVGTSLAMVLAGKLIVRVTIGTTWLQVGRNRTLDSGCHFVWFVCCCGCRGRAGNELYRICQERKESRLSIYEEGNSLESDQLCSSATTTKISTY